MNETEKNPAVSSDNDNEETVNLDVDDTVETSTATDAVLVSPELHSQESVVESAGEESTTTTEEPNTSEKIDLLPEHSSVESAEFIAEAGSVADKNPRRRYFMAAAVVIVLGIFLAIFYNMEESGKLNTGVFDSIKQFKSNNETVAVVNGEKISGQDLNISMQQMAAGAKLQGIDVEDPKVQKDIKAQSVEVLVNTELLLQEAKIRGINVTDEDVQKRHSALIEEVGGEETLNERMNEFGITNKTLMRDIKHELTIKQLLDQVFAEEKVEISEADVLAMYESLGGEEAGLPPLAEIKTQLEAQITASKEQEVISNLVELLRTNAEIEVKIEV
jgi:hypothetical protein